MEYRAVGVTPEDFVRKRADEFAQEAAAVAADAVEVAMDPSKKVATAGRSVKRILGPISNIYTGVEFGVCVLNETFE